MPAYPDLTCKVCKATFPHPRTKGNLPRTCSSKCRRALRDIEKELGHAVCDRCGKGYKRGHMAQRFCSADCRDGCTYCGKPIPPKKKEFGMNSIYCTKACQKKAWGKTKLPICRLCQREVPLPSPPQALRNPPLIHSKCRKAQEEAKKIREEGKKVLATTIRKSN